MEKVRRIVLIQKDIYKQIRAIAPREYRSFSAQILHFLQEAVACDQSADRFCEAEARVLGPASQAAKARESTYL
jgi:hypothetical protein